MISMRWVTSVETLTSGVKRVVISVDGPITGEMARQLINNGWRHIGRAGWGFSDRWAAGTW